MPIITEILDDVFPLFTKSTSIRLQTLILNEFEKSELEKRNLYGFKEFKIIVSEVMNSPLLNINDKKISIIDRLEIIFKSGEIKNLPKEIDFLGKNGFDIFCYEVFCFFWWKLQFSEEDTYKPIVKYFEYNVSIINDLYINFWRFVCGHELFPNIRPLIEKYNLSALLDLYSVEDYFVDLYVNGFLLLNGEVKDLKYFYEQMYNIMHLIPFNRITRLSSNFGITPKKSLYPPTENMSFSFEIPLNIKSSLITLFHQLSMQLNFILINELMSKTDPYKSVKKMNEDEIHQLVEQIRQCSQLMDSISRLQRKVDTPYFLNKKVSLLTALSVLLYQFYEKENIFRRSAQRHPDNRELYRSDEAICAASRRL